MKLGAHALGEKRHGEFGAGRNPARTESFFTEDGGNGVAWMKPWKAVALIVPAGLVLGMAAGAASRPVMVQNAKDSWS